jgi:hypothetical protein
MLEAHRRRRRHHVLPAICRHQRPNLLLALALRDPGPGLRDATPALRHHQLYAARWRGHESVDHGPVWAAAPVARRRGRHVRVPRCHRGAGGQIWRAMGELRSRGLGRGGLPVRVHVCVWGDVGTGSVGDAGGDFPDFAACEGSLFINL